MFSIQPIEEKSLKQGGFNQEEIEKLRAFLGTLEKPSNNKSSSTFSLEFSSKVPISIRLKVLNETFANSWVFDSGAIDHMTLSSHQFNIYNLCPSSRKIATFLVLDSSAPQIT